MKKFLRENYEEQKKRWMEGDRAFSEPLANYLTAHMFYYQAESEMFDRIHEILGYDADKGDFVFEDIGIDTVDWDGTSVELTGTNDGLVPTEEQIQKIWDLGFTVIRIDYKTKLNGSHGMSGDWHLVKGMKVGQCYHNTKEEIK